MKEIREDKDLQLEPSLVEEVLLEEKKKRRFRRALRSTIYALITVAALAVLIASLWMPVLKIYGNSMTPALYEGDLVISFKKGQYQTGDIVGLYYGNKLLVKRIIAGPGTMVDIDFEGNVYVDEEKIEEPYLEDKSYGEVTIDLPYQVPEKRWFVLGDHRSTSVDSRNHLVAAISEEQIVGQLLYRIWPWEQIGKIK